MGQVNTFKVMTSSLSTPQYASWVVGSARDHWNQTWILMSFWWEKKKKTLIHFHSETVHGHGRSREKVGAIAISKYKANYFIVLKVEISHLVKPTRGPIHVQKLKALKTEKDYMKE